jgi:hypothetical protein
MEVTIWAVTEYRLLQRTFGKITAHTLLDLESPGVYLGMQRLSITVASQNHV